jgi:hypothetical protein
MIGEMAKGRTDLIQTLIQLQIFTAQEEEILDTPFEEFEQRLEELLGE